MSRTWRKQLTPRIVPDDAEKKFASFAGVVNVHAPKDIGMQALSLGDNVVVTDTKKLLRRDGFTPYIEGNVTSTFGCGTNLYAVVGGSIYRVVSPTDKHLLVAGLTGDNYDWDELNGEAYFVNGVEAGILDGDTFKLWRTYPPSTPVVGVLSTGTAPSAAANVGGTYVRATFRVCATYLLDDGRETAASEVAFVETTPYANLFSVSVPPLYARTNIYCTEPDGTVFQRVASVTTQVATFNPQQRGQDLPVSSLNREPLPEGVTHVCATQKGAILAGKYEPSLKYSVVYRSEPLGYHLWDASDGYIMVPGELGLLLEVPTGVICGTSRGVWHYGFDNKLDQLCDYGVLPGTCGDVTAEGIAYFWTKRGMCKAMPFENLTETSVSMPPGLTANAAILYMNGMQQFVAVTQGDGGEPFNKRRS